MNLYPSFKEKQLDSGHADNVDLNSDTLKFALMEGYTYDSTDKYLADVATVVASSSAVGSPTVTNGTFDCADATVTTPAAGHTISSVILYNDTGNSATSPLIAHIDKQQDGSTNLSLVTNGQNVTIGIHANGVFDL